MRRSRVVVPVKPLRFLAFGDIHVPNHDKDAVAWVLQKVEQIKPDVVVHLGDGHEADAASKYPSEATHDLSDEFQQHDALLASVRKVAGRKAHFVFLHGNHDDNILAKCRLDKRIRTLCDFRNNSNELTSGAWKQVPYIYDRRQGAFRLGQVTFIHGYEIGGAASKSQSILMGQPYGLLVHGHTHHVQHVEQARLSIQVPLPYWFASPGCLCNLKPDYVRRKRTHLWGHAVVVGEAVPLKSPRLSREWSAHVEVFRMAGEE